MGSVRKIVLAPKNVWGGEKYKFSQALRLDGVANLILISGQASMNARGEIVGKGDFVAQVRQIFENMRLILAETGGTIDDIVKMVTYVRDISDLSRFTTIRAEYFKNTYPTSTVVEVSKLALPDMFVEIEAIAAL